MGKAAERLALTEHMYENAPEQATSDSREVGQASTTLDQTAGKLRDMAADLGLTGSTGDAAWDRFALLAKDLNVTADAFSALAKVAEKAHGAVVVARDAYRELPEGDIDGWQKAALIGGGTLIAGPLGTLTGSAAVDYLSGQAAADREARAKAALRALESAMDLAVAGLPETDDSGDRGGTKTPLPPDDTSDGTSNGTTSGTGGRTTPVRSTPVGTTPVGTTPIGTTPIGTTPVGTTPTTHGPSLPTGSPVPPVTSTPTHPGTTTPDSDMGGGWVPGSGPTGGYGGGGIGGGGYDGTTGSGAYGGAMAGGLAFGGAAAGAVGLGRGLGAAGTGIAGGSLGGIGGIGGGGGGLVGGIGGAGGTGSVAGAGASTGSGLAGSRSSSLVGGGATGTPGGAGGRGTGGMVGGGGAAGGAAGSAGKKRQRRGAGYLGPDIDIDDDDVMDVPGGSIAAGGRGQASVAPANLDIEADDTW